ncbi:hypothetical protein [Paenibacillus elgii]|uniref:Uncharacterized protein n=1 Tax=Paenibacillus elgii TaxID=189691 RepID=A0A161S616_9BACL|nr:hypothetical protein [Paenibacillus elgii]KZE80354.1 hypothetical protein AV654_12670 [Paenibacillus elgii]NEN82446.1 hypothetical protein [Paenibacillus elgii]
MNDDSVEFHLKQARLHLEQALTATKLQASNEEAHQLMSEQWGHFFAFLIGDGNRETELKET